MHIDALFGEPGKNVIDFDLIESQESQFRHLTRVAVSVHEWANSSSTLLKRLRSGSRKNATYTAFREVGRVIRTVQLLLPLGGPAAPAGDGGDEKGIESFIRFSQWVGFSNRGVVADNDPVEQEKAMKFNAAHERSHFSQCPGHRRGRANCWKREVSARSPGGGG